MRQCHHLSAWIVMLVCTRSIVWAAEDPDALSKRLFQQALSSYEAADFVTCSKRLAEAARAAKSPGQRARVAFSYGLTLVVLDKPAKARVELRTALRHDPSFGIGDENLNTQQVKLLEQVRQELASDVTIESDMDGAVLWIDGRKQPTVPTTLSLAAGAHTISMQAPSSTHKVEVALIVPAEARLQVRLPLASQQHAVTVQTDPPTGEVIYLNGAPLGPSPTTAHVFPGRHTLSVTHQGRLIEERFSVAAKAEQLDLSLAEQASPPRIWTWVALGLGVGAAAAGIALGISSGRDNDAYNNSIDPVERAELRARGEMKGTWGTALAYSGGALALTSVALFFLEPILLRRDAPRLKRTPRLASRVRLTATGLAFSY